MPTKCLIGELVLSCMFITLQKEENAFEKFNGNRIATVLFYVS